ncbi:ABC transporter ATP-binding protein [Candidatus Micrarchaeota archaeon]|nr:ABC transporter ATP-binding protein [Candidatus Micrarchaeota archaeon]
MPPAIQSQDLIVRVPGRAVLDGFSLSVPAGCIYGLLGASGCGKSTFMNACAGLSMFEAGVLSVAGRAPGRGRLDVGYCTQYDSFYEDLTVDENVSFFGRVLGVPSALLEPRRDLLLKTCGLTEQKGQSASLLSGGQKRRLNVVLALLGQPEVLLVDEPTVGLDPLTRKDLWQLLRAVRASGTTILLSTHYMFEAESLCDRIAIMAQGRVAAEGTLDELRDRFVPNELVRLSCLPADPVILQALAARLRASRLAISVVYEPNGLLVSCPDPRKTIAAMYAFLKETPESVTLLDVQEPSFNDVFFLATQMTPEAGNRGAGLA